MKTGERHYLQSSGFATDFLIGLPDGIILPFALAAGISFIAPHSWIVLTACIIESVVLAVVFGIATYQTVVNQVEEYPVGNTALSRKKNFVSHLELQQILTHLELGPEILEKAAEEGRNYKVRWSNLLSGMDLGSAEPDFAKAKKNGWNVAFAILLGACIPLLPYIFIDAPAVAFRYAALLTFVCLVILGFLKASYTGQRPWKVGLRLIITGLVVAGAAFLVAWIFR